CSTLVLCSSKKMANFPVNPLAFLPHGMTVEQGPPDRKARVDMALSGHLPLNHDRFLIAETSRAIPVHLRQEARSALAGMLNHDSYSVRFFEDSPLGLGLFCIRTVPLRDALIGKTYMLYEEVEVTFVKHDEAINM
uniref:DUF7597 domain-containing protein n=1 Tax=Aegilops tauschii subsp. strangulata TaxID=200361 RepID=A0A453JYF4_AEGTS